MGDLQKCITHDITGRNPYPLIDSEIAMQEWDENSLISRYANEYLIIQLNEQKDEMIFKSVIHRETGNYIIKNLKLKFYSSLIFNRAGYYAINKIPDLQGEECSHAR